MSRLPNQPGERIDRGTKVSFTFDGKRVEAHEGDTIGSALYAAGQRTFSRSFKYHRRRGLMCCAGQCPNCIVSVDGAPGARACIEPVRDGLKVEHVNAVSLELDPMRATDVVGGPFTPPGFYYKTFIRPRKLWPLYEKVLRNVAGLGKLREEQAEREWRTEYRRRHADVLVVGGGIAGLKAAIAAAQLGADVVLADEGPALGGQQLIEADVAVVEGLVGASTNRRRRDPGTRLGTRLLRRPRPGLAAGHASPGPRAATRIRDRRDRAAAGVRRQRSPRRDAGRRRAQARGAVRRQPRRARGDRDHLRPRLGRGAGAARRGRRDRRGRRSASRRRRRRPRAPPVRHPGVHRPHGRRGQGSQGGQRGGDRARRRRRRAHVPVRPAGRLGRHDSGHVACSAGRRAQLV